jgi:hypothetical protein
MPIANSPKIRCPNGVACITFGDALSVMIADPDHTIDEDRFVIAGRSTS